MFAGPAVLVHTFINKSTECGVSHPFLSFVLSERGQGGGRRAPADIGDVPDVLQEGLCKRRSCEEGKQVGGGEGWREGKGPMTRGAD